MAATRDPVLGDVLSTLRKIAPELTTLIERRYTVLRNVYFAQPLGRRVLAARLKWPERMVRKELDFLREQGLVAVDPNGMVVTVAGERVLQELKAYVRELHGLVDLERALARHLGLRQVIVVPGDCDSDPTVKKDLARATARYLHEILREGDILAVAGGTTLAEVAHSLPPAARPFHVTVVPARGGLGEDVEIQANTVAAQIAQALGGTYRLLHVPDDLGEDALQTILAEPRVREVVELIRSANVVLHGIGHAEEMARRRGLGAEPMRLLQEGHAVGEAFGYYFDRDGRMIYATSSVGLRWEDLAAIDQVIAVGGGSHKAEAALAVLSSGYQDVFITDEGAGRLMLEILARGGRRHREAAVAAGGAEPQG